MLDITIQAALQSSKTLGYSDHLLIVPDNLFQTVE